MAARRFSFTRIDIAKHYGSALPLPIIIVTRAARGALEYFKCWIINLLPALSRIMDSLVF
jgi:hypothetical protein